MKPNKYGYYSILMTPVADHDEIWCISLNEIIDIKYKILVSGNHALRRYIYEGLYI